VPDSFPEGLLAFQRGLSSFVTRNYKLQSNKVTKLQSFPQNVFFAFDFKNKDRFLSKAYGRFYKQIRYLCPVRLREILTKPDRCGESKAGRIRNFLILAEPGSRIILLTFDEKFYFELANASLITSTLFFTKKALKRFEKFEKSRFSPVV
jgi:hypothetical protein